MNNPQKNDFEKPNNDSKAILNLSTQSNDSHQPKSKKIIIAGIITVITILLGISAFIFGPSILEKLHKEEAMTTAKSIVDETAESEPKGPIVMTIGDIKISARDYNYYYLLMYNYTANQAQQYQQQYGQNVLGFDSLVSPDKQNYPQPNESGETITWANYLSGAAIERAHQFEALYKEALASDKKKYSLTDGEQKKVDDQLQDIRGAAAKHGMSANDYLKEFYGEGITESFLKKQLGKETIVERFNTDKIAEFKASWTDENIRTIYETDKDIYDVANLRAFFTEDATIANAILLRVTDESTFLSSVGLYASAGYDAEKETSFFYKNKYSIEANISAEAANWAFANTRFSGDKSVFNTENGYCVVWLKSVRFPPITVDVRHILISFKDDPQSQEAATTVEIDAAKNKADEVYNRWQSGEKTVESFGEIAKTFSSDTGSAENGGLYEDVTVGSMVAPFENWCFDPSRKPGETGIVKTEYGYHLMYMVTNDSKNFQYLGDIREEKASEDNEKYVKGLLASDKYKLTKNDENISNAETSSLKIINTLIARQNSSQY